MFFATHGSNADASSFLGWHFGWDHENENVIWFWFKNTGFFIPLIATAILWGKNGELVSKRLLFFYLPFTLWFVVPNLLKLAPWVWDNIKVLFFWYIASVPLVAMLLARWWRDRGLMRVASVVLFISLTLAGGLDVWRVIYRTTEYREIDRDGISMAETIKRVTTPDALVLHAPTYNPPSVLTGRKTLLGYPGHIWSHGQNFAPREAEIKRIYSGAADAESLLSKNHVDYVIVSPLEKEMMQVNESFFQRFPKVAEIGQYHLYKISR
jgi:hypothetical protein